MTRLLNKKYLFWCGISLVIVLFVLICCLANRGVRKEKTCLTSYSLDLSYDDSSHELFGNEQVVYFNNSDNMFSVLYFHLYPNAFREDATNKVVSANHVGEAYPNGYSYGSIEISGVTGENGKLMNYEICGEDKNILAVELPTELYPEESVFLSINFKTSLANINHRLGYGENTINFGNFYPIACVYESGIGFSQNLYLSNGDPFYSDCANYQVSITYKSNFEIASTGEKIAEKKENGFVTASYKATKVRDFCFVLSCQFQKVCKLYNDIEIIYYGYNGDKNLEESLTACIDAVQTFEEMFGDYPYPQLSIVKSNFVYGGMEYPNIVLISDSITAQNDINYVIVHEIAHQWWYGMVGNDEYNHAWLDEGLAEYSTLLFYRKNSQYGEDFDALINGAVENYKLFERVYIKVYGSVDGRIERPLCDFQTEPEYVQCVYTKGVIMFNSLRELVGDKKFMATLKDYFEKFQFQNAAPENIIARFVSGCGRMAEEFFDSWLNGEVVIK